MLIGFLALPEGAKTDKYQLRRARRQTNNTFMGANFAWIAVGGVTWLLILFGLSLPDEV